MLDIFNSSSTCDNLWCVSTINYHHLLGILGLLIFYCPCLCPCSCPCYPHLLLSMPLSIVSLQWLLRVHLMRCFNIMERMRCEFGMCYRDKVINSLNGDNHNHNKDMPMTMQLLMLTITWWWSLILIQSNIIRLCHHKFSTFCLFQWTLEAICLDTIYQSWPWVLQSFNYDDS